MNGKKMLEFKRLLLMIIAFFCCTPLTFAQEVVPEWQKRAFDWANGGMVTEDWFMKDFLQGYKDIVWGEYSTFIDMAKVIGLIMATIYFGIKAYEMMTGDKKIDIIPLLRPFALCMVLIFWKPFIQTVSAPTDMLASVAGAKYEQQQRVITNLRYERANLQNKLIDQLFEQKAKIDASIEVGDKWYQKLGSKMREKVTSLVPSLIELRERLGFQIQLFITQLCETLALWILRIAVYGLFLIQIIYSGVLIMFGPFSVAMAIHPAFRDSFVTWIGRFISVNLYLGIGYIVLFIAGILQRYALQSEIKKFNDMFVDGHIDMTKLLYMQGNGLLTFGTVIVCFVLSAVAMFTVPSISTWIVSTSGVTSAVSTASRAGQVIASKGTSLLIKK